MSKLKPTNPDFLNGVPELLVLQLLARTPMHGYELVRSIARATDTQLEFGEGCIYPILHRLERDGLLVGESVQAGKRTRIVYRVTAAGLQRLTQSTSAWEAVVASVNRVLQGGGDAGTAMA
ncbi:transcriptional regulator, PadR family [Singulisphaera sp. GP187]|uniref:PadR family transcriptional regulator n=1 Tax=Singulisphaera sp. GP187 TaxID=1882752 RepID=UPI000925BA12|nr:helix-turn-helix transcriptional regulator [Singulisphaera sp. GP187]SIO35285.1 transcriptional regulator, PadR family [Singulisphaera sp. GP187]